MRVLVVCTGNICRSPAGELLLKEYLGPIANISSAGTRALEGRGIEPPMLELLENTGIDGSSHRARQATRALTKDSDLIIAMTASHRGSILAEDPGALRRTFTLAELGATATRRAPLPDGSLEERIDGLWTAVSALRPDLRDDETADVPDPYRKDRATYATSFAMIDSNVRAFSEWITA